MSCESRVVGGQLTSDRLPGRSLSLYRIVFSTILALLAGGCASAPPVVVEEPEPDVSTGPPIVQPGDGYLMYYVDGADIHVRNTGATIDSVVVAGVSNVVASASPDGSHVAVAYARGDSAELVMIDTRKGGVSSVHSAPLGEYTLAWSVLGDSLGAALRPAAEGSRGVVLIADIDGNARDIGCSVSNRFLAWRSNGQVIVGDAANVYTVSARDCSTLATLSRRERTQIRYSPDGNRVLYERNGGLIGARYDGASSQWIARSRYQPNNARWSPDGRRIAFEVQSEQYGNITHLAIYEYSTGRMEIHSDEKPLGVPRDMNPCWSPSGDRIAHDRDYFRSGGGQEYVQRQKVTSATGGGTEVVVAEELVRDVSPAEPGPCAWIDDNHLVVTLADGPRIVNIETKVAYRLPENSRLLYATVLRVSREQ